jgi:hypothetical protein
MRGDAFEKYPQLRNMVDNPSQVPEHLINFWNELDHDQKATFCSLDNIVENFQWIMGVVGSGNKTASIS